MVLRTVSVTSGLRREEFSPVRYMIIRAPIVCVKQLLRWLIFIIIIIIEY